MAENTEVTAALRIEAHGPTPGPSFVRRLSWEAQPSLHLNLEAAAKQAR